MGERIFGIDVSSHQGLFDYSKAKSKGVRWVIFKGTDVGSVTGVGFIDTQAENNYMNAKMQGLLVGSYCWMDATRDGKYQAEYYLNNIYKKYPLDFPPILDFEEVEGLKNKARHIYETRQWLDLVEKETGRVPMIYTASWYTNNYNQNDLAWMSRYPLWVAMYSYVTIPLLPSFALNYKIWQYASNASYPNYSKSGGNSFDWGSATDDGLDMNWFNGSYNELLTFCNKTSEPIPELPKILYKAEVIATDGLFVRNAPHPTATKITALSYKRVVDVYEENGIWKKISPIKNEWCNGTWLRKIPDIIVPEPLPLPADVLFKAQCVVSSLTVRIGAGVVYAKTNRYLTKGEIVDVYEVSPAQWYRIGTGEWVSGNIAYMKKIVETPPVVIPPITPPEGYLFQGKVVTPYAYLPVREGPGTSFKEIGERKPGDILNILESNKDRWYRIGVKEWIWGRHIQSTTPPLTTLAYPLEKKFPISQVFGVNSSIYGAARGHNGVDYASYGGTKLIASADGFVETREDNTTYGYGRHIRIRVQGGVLIYGHMRTIYPVLGAQVKKGDVIGLSDGAVGDPYAGFSSGNHLHFELRSDQEPSPMKAGNYTYWAVDTLPITELPNT